MVTGRRAVGLGAVHCLLPEQKLTVAELPEFADLDREAADFALSCGIDTVGAFDDAARASWPPRPSGSSPSGSRSSRTCCCSSAPRAPDVLLGSDAGRVHADSGVDVTFSFTVDGLGCTGSSAAWALGRDLSWPATAPRGVLIAHASRPTAVDRVRFPVTVIGDGAFALTLVPGGRPALRAHRMRDRRRLSRPVRRRLQADALVRVAGGVRVRRPLPLRARPAQPPGARGTGRAGAGRRRRRPATTSAAC